MAFIFFFIIIRRSVVEFYYNPQVRQHNKGLLGWVRANALKHGWSRPIGMYRLETQDLKPRVCFMLSTPKFGYKVSAH